MKTISYGKLTVAAVLSVLLLISCAKTDANVETVSICISARLDDPDTRTVLDGRKVLWTDTDRVTAVTFNSETGLFDLLEDLAPTWHEGSEASFLINAVKHTKVLYLVYPSSAVEGYDCENNLLQMNSTGTYTGSTGSFASGSSFSIACVDENGNATFRNLMGLVKVEISSQDVEEFTLTSNTSETLCGTFGVNPETLEVSAIEGKTDISLRSEDACISPGVYYIPIFPVEFEKGFRIALTNRTGDIASKRYEDKYILERNRIANLGIESDWNIKYLQTRRTVTVQFADGQNGEWPYTQTIPEKAGSLMGPYTTEEEPDLEYYFTLAKYIDAKSFRVTAGGGLRFGGTEGDYMLLPALEGYRLASVSITGSKNNACTFCIMSHSDTEESSSVITGGETKVIEKNFGAQTFTLPETVSGTSYRLTLPTESLSSINSLTLTYKIH